MPTGLVKSTIHAPVLRAGAGPLGDVEDDRHGSQRLGQATCAGRLLPDAAEFERPRLVPVAGGLPADPELDQHRRRAVHAVFGVGGPAHGRLVAVRAHDPRRHRPDRGEPGLVGIDEHDLRHARREPPEPVRELWRVRRPAADHRQLHVNARTSTPACATWQATSRPDSGVSSGVIVAHASVDTAGSAGGIGSPGTGRSPSAARRLAGRGGQRRDVGGGAFGSGTADSRSCV